MTLYSKTQNRKRTVIIARWEKLGRAWGRGYIPHTAHLNLYSSSTMNTSIFTVTCSASQCKEVLRFVFFCLLFFQGTDHTKQKNVQKPHRIATLQAKRTSSLNNADSRKISRNHSHSASHSRKNVQKPHRIATLQTSYLNNAHSRKVAGNIANAWLPHTNIRENLESQNKQVPRFEYDLKMTIGFCVASIAYRWGQRPISSADTATGTTANA